MLDTARVRVLEDLGQLPEKVKLPLDGQLAAVLPQPDV